MFFYKMKFFETIRETIKVMKEKMEFQKAVSQETLPIRRKAYLEQMKKEAINEGKELAKKKCEPKKPIDFRFGFENTGIGEFKGGKKCWRI